LLEIGKAKREANLLIGKYKKEPDLSFNNKSEQQQNRFCQKMTKPISHTIRGQLLPRA